MRTTLVRAFSSLVAASLVIVGAVAIATPASAAPRDDVVSSTNQQRAAARLPGLVQDATLNAAAQAWANEMSRVSTMRHSTNEWRAARIPAGWYTNGENIAHGYSSPTAVMQGWMASRGHKENILRSSYTHIGVGYVAAGNYWVQIFAGYDADKAPTPKPIGSLDGAEVRYSESNASLHINGWAIEPERMTASMPIHIYVLDPTGATRGAALTADGMRADVGRAFPSAGSRHGYSLTIPVDRVGTYKVCAYAIGTVGSSPTSAEIGCRSTQFGPGKPIGSVDEIAVKLVNQTPTISLRGWALDFAMRNAATQAHVYITDPRGQQRGFALDANTQRNDVGNAFQGAGANHGFQLDVPVTIEGTYRVCVYSISAPIFGGSNTPLLCKPVTLRGAPKGSLDAVSVDNGKRSVSLRGWALDGMAPASVTQVHVYVSHPGGSRPGVAVNAALPRSDVGRAFPGAGDLHGFTVDAPLNGGSGPYQVCAFAIAAPTLGSGNLPLGCRTVILP